MSDSDKITYEDFIKAIEVLESARPLDTSREAHRYAMLMNPVAVQGILDACVDIIYEWSYGLGRLWMWLKGWRQKDIDDAKATLERFHDAR